MRNVPGRDQKADRRALRDALVGACADAGASIGMLYLPDPDPTRRVLHLTLTSGLSREFAAPWSRVGLDDPIPVADAVREGRLVWLGGQEDTARRYPRLGLVLPYDFALAAVPLTEEAPDRAREPTGAGLLFLWPGSHGPDLHERERKALESARSLLTRVLRRAAYEGRPLRPPPHPVVLRPLPAPTPGPAEAAATMAFVRRLPGGNCALDLNGTITLITPEAADLLGAPVSHLLGALPWEALPWMDTPAIENHYRATAMSRLSRSFIAERPTGERLCFDLYPDNTGISVRITTVGDRSSVPPHAPPADPEQPAPSRATALYPLMLLAATLTEAAHAQDVVEKAADQIVPSLGAHALALLAEQDGRVRIVGHRGYSAEHLAELDGTPVSADTAITHILHTANPLFFGDVGELLAAHPDAVVEDGMAAWAFLPLIASNRPIGSLVLAYKHPRVFAPGERAVLTSIAGLIAQALDRARLYDATHQLARSLQTGLLPHTLPRVPHLDVAARYLPAAYGLEIGGDFYDLIRIDDTTVAAAIGDVQGHNVNAAALMGQVRTAVHAGAGAPPEEVLARTNRLVTDLEPGLFTSCLYAHIDLAGHTVRLASAGHPPPLLRHPGGATEMLNLPAGLLLGIEPGAAYTAVEIPFSPGTLLALFTDGLVEAPGRDIEDAIGAVARRIDAAPEHHPLGDLADELIEHAHRDGPRPDDIALLLLRSEGPERSVVPRHP
ncbi:SpoIIE family protein phosphatase [Streptomyces sp. NRRL S-237]|uniref:SpoIIE family protein phosphatase n=1 Tax=Streptomyces sp. NRRL S-237 TaxID=1463895 RepID=UPI00068AD67B|nr:SpoIIE family protein phosphatase [Streptomyces sp. NRRL S-237]